MIGDLARDPDIIADMLALYIRKLLQADVAPQTAGASKEAIGVEKGGAVTEFEVQVILE